MRTRTDQLTEALRARIGGGQYPVGSKLPSEQALAATFQVSRTTVREAVTRLKESGLVETRRGTAARVCARDADGGLAMPRSIEALLGFLEVRGAIEAEMAARAAVRRTDAQCDAIEAALLAIDAASRAGSTGVEEDLAFHLAIGQATANAYWSQFVRLFADPMRAAIRITRANEARRTDFAAAVAREHASLFEAIRARNAGAARQAASRHLRRAAERVLRADRAFWQEEGRTLAEEWGAEDWGEVTDACDPTVIS